MSVKCPFWLLGCKEVLLIMYLPPFDKHKMEGNLCSELIFGCEEFIKN